MSRVQLQNLQSPYKGTRQALGWERFVMQTMGADICTHRGCGSISLSHYPIIADSGVRMNGHIGSGMAQKACPDLQRNEGNALGCFTD